MPSFIEQLKLHEGVRTKPYVDTVGKVTIGVGFNLTDVGLSMEEIDYILLLRVELLEVELSKRLFWYSCLGEVRQKVLLDMAYNLGVTGMLSFQQMLSHMSQSNWDAAAADMLNSKWATQVGQRAIRLAGMMKSGQDYTI